MLLHASTSSNDMGRRKLPSLPSVPMSTASAALGCTSNTTSTAQGDSNKYSIKSVPLKTLAEISYNAGTSISPLVTGSSRTLPLSYRESGTASQTRFIIPKANTSASNNSSRSTSPSTLFYSGNNLSYPNDPAIIPGEIFKIDSKDIKSSRPTIMSNSAITNSQQLYGNKNALPLNKASMETLSQLKYKKELREALNVRRQTLEACEIEANHRQYTINRMLNSGLMPSHRPIEIEAIPLVTKCTLPSELTKGAKIVPQYPKLNAQPTKIASDSYSFGTKQPVSKYDSLSYNPLQQTTNVKKSVACQFDPSFIKENQPPMSSIYSLPLTSLRYQLKDDNQRQRDSETQTDKTAETQTEFNIHNYNENDTSSSLLRKKYDSLKILSPSHEENYDHQRLRKRFDKQRFEFTNSQNISDIENKQREILFELDQRRNKISSMIDLRYLQKNPLIGYPAQTFPTTSSDYASTVPHYGSLPRMDYPTTKSRLTYSKKSNYGSLPRNYERYLGGENVYEPSSNYFMDGSTSLYNLNKLHNYDPNNSYQFSSRSLNYLNSPPTTNYLPYQQLRSFDKNKPQQLPYGVDSFATPTDYYAGNMVSQYANYLNNQFLFNQQDFDLNILPPPLNEPFIKERFNAISSAPIDLSNSKEISAPQTAYSNIYSSYNEPQQPLNFSHVYSRNENNYGMRPFKYSPGDYGNYLHNRAQNLHQLDKLQDFINHNRSLYESDYYPNLSQSNYYSPNLLQQRYSNIPDPGRIDDLNRVMNQYSRNSSANFQRSPPFQSNNSLLYNEQNLRGRPPQSYSKKGVDKINYLKSISFIDGR